MLRQLRAPFRSALQANQRVGNSGVQLIRAPVLQYPAPPSRREGKLSAETHATGGRVERNTHDVIANRNSERQSRQQLKHAPYRVYAFDGDIHIPSSPERSRACLNTLS